MKKKISICFANDNPCYFTVVSMLSEIRLEKNKKQINISVYSFYILFFLGLFLVGLFLKDKVSVESAILLILPIPVLFGFVYAYSVISSVKLDRNIRKNQGDYIEIVISESKCFFVKITIEEYEEELTKRIEKEISEIEAEIFRRRLDIEKMKKSLHSLSKEEDEDLTDSIVGKIFMDEAEISQFETKKQEFQEILEQIKN